MNDLADHLFTTAKLDTDDLKIRWEEVDLPQLIRGAAEAASAGFDGYAIDAPLVAQQRTVWADRKLLLLSISQLLDNAVKYGRSGLAVEVEVQEEQAELLIKGTNEGSLIPPEQRGKVFQCFYCCFGSAQIISGSGIGLSIVKRITEAHNGRSWVNNDPENAQPLS